MPYTGSKSQVALGPVLAIGPVAGSVAPTGVTGATTSASANVTVASTAGIAAGMSVTGTGIPTGATVSSITSSTVFVLSAAATATGSSVALTFAIGYTPIFEVKSSDRTGLKYGVEDVTNFNSAGVMEKRKAILDPGQWAVKGNRVSGDAGQLALRAAFADPTNGYMFKLTYDMTAAQTTTGDYETFNALVTALDTTLEVGKTVSISATLDITGMPVFTAGS